MSDALAVADGLVLWRGNRQALAAASFEIPRGAVTVLIGPNGSGKTTLLLALAGVLEPAAGRLQVLGGRAEEVRTRLAFVPQSMQPTEGTPLTVREVVGMGRYPGVGLWRRFSAADRERVRAAMARLDVLDLARRDVAGLSGGQRQRVNVAQALAQDHDALLLDEPLTGLDLVSARAIDEVVHAERDAGRSVVLTSHDLDEARAADHVLLLSGRVVAAGPPRHVLTRENLEVAYRLGSLHPDGHDGPFVDDPVRAAHDAEAHPRAAHRERSAPVDPDAGERGCGTYEAGSTSRTTTG